MIDKNHPKLSLRCQCALLAVNRNRLVSRPKLSAEDREIMRDLDWSRLRELGHLKS